MTRAEARWAIGWALVVMLITCLPYLYMVTLAPSGTIFSGLLYAADDHCVYLSWEEQGAQGHFLLRNLFTGEWQRGIYVSLLSWVIGSVARLTGLPLMLAHHLARVLAGMALLVLVYRFCALFTRDRATRCATFWFTAFSAGVGWMYEKLPFQNTGPVDGWQPEAITFLSLYVNGLFCVAMSLSLGVMILLLTAEGETGRRRWVRVIGAGVLGLLLGNIHSYDVITLAGVWGSYLIVRGVTERRFPGRALLDSLVAALVALPSTLYQYYLYRTEPVFRMRADDTFLSPAFINYLLGYGLLIPLAVGGGIWLIQRARRDRQPLGHCLLPLTWAVVGFAIPYLPFAFQRKLVQGQHLPLAFLAAVGAVALADKAALGASSLRWALGSERQAPSVKRLVRNAKRQAPSAERRLIPPSAKRQAPSAAFRAAVVAGLLLLTMPSLWVFVQRDIQTATQTTSDLNRLPTFWPQEEVEAMQWARRHLPADGVIFCSTVAGRLFPALAGRSVYVGHWSETPRAHERMMETFNFYRAVSASPEERRAFLQERNIRYLYQGTTERRMGAVDLSRDPFLRPIYQNGGVTLYELRPPDTAQRPSGKAERAF